MERRVVDVPERRVLAKDARPDERAEVDRRLVRARERRPKRGYEQDEREDKPKHPGAV
jgi:hypothetical protein